MFPSFREIVLIQIMFLLSLQSPKMLLDDVDNETKYKIF